MIYYSALSVVAPAKINLCLHITGYDEATKYHHLETICVFPEWGDILQFYIAEEDGLHIDGAFANIPNNEDNLILKAKHIFTTSLEISLPPLAITVTKNIPDQAGLGGGSSDAAATLLALRKMFSPDLSTDMLLKMGEQIGADVPVCLMKKPVLAKGYGEKLTALPMIGRKYYCLIAKPEISLSTQKIFQNLQDKNNSALSETLDRNAILNHALQYGVNHLKTPAIKEAPEIEAIITILQSHGPVKADMSGSGSACFALFEDDISCRKAHNALRNKFQNIFLKSTCLYI
ncbi:MAG: 4-(cytidine 5'-diphospho)-2-C-methyl-D-erythritol kinase [Pseudomonadota bacterium]